MSQSSSGAHGAPLRVIVDGTAATVEPSGARTRLELLYGAAARRQGLDVTVLTEPGAGLDAPLAAAGCAVQAARGESPLGRLSRQRHPALRAASGDGYDLAAVETLPLPAGAHLPLAATVHDLRFMDSRFASLARRTWARFFLRRNLLRAAAVIAVSDTTARDLDRRGLCPRSKVFVVPNAAAAPIEVRGDRRKALLAGCGINQPFFLCLGRMEKRKNIGVLLDGWDEFVRQSGRGLLLVLAGPAEGRHGREIRNRARRSGGVLFTSVVTDETRNALLQEAIALVQPSLHEGFGLPLLEAMTAGIPVACSSIPAHREVAGEAALYFDPDDRGGLARALDLIAREEEFRTRLSAAGTERCNLFSWGRSAELLEACYRAILEPRNDGAS